MIGRARGWVRAAGLRLAPPAGLRVLVVAPEGGVGGPFTKAEQLRGAFGRAGARFNVAYVLSAARPDFRFLEAARARGRRIVVNQDGVYFPAFAPHDWRERNAPMRRLLACADWVIYQSAFSRAGADRFLGPPPDGRSEVLHNAVDTGAFRPAEGRPSGPRRRLLATGRMGGEWLFAHFEALLGALSRLLAKRRDWSLECAGCFSGPDDPFGRRAADAIARRRLAGYVHLLPPFRREEAPALYRRAEVFLHFKTLDWCPNAVLEAMASGLAVVYCAAGGTGELVGDAGVGVPSEVDWERVRPPDTDAYAAAVSEAMDRAAALGAAARARAEERFSLKRWIERHRQVFGALLRGGRP